MYHICTDLNFEMLGIILNLVTPVRITVSLETKETTVIIFN